MMNCEVHILIQRLIILHVYAPHVYQVRGVTVQDAPGRRSTTARMVITIIVLHSPG